MKKDSIFENIPNHNLNILYSESSKVFKTYVKEVGDDPQFLSKNEVKSEALLQQVSNVLAAENMDKPHLMKSELRKTIAMCYRILTEV